MAMLLYTTDITQPVGQSRPVGNAPPLWQFVISISGYVLWEHITVTGQQYYSRVVTCLSPLLLGVARTTYC